MTKQPNLRKAAEVIRQAVYEAQYYTRLGNAIRKARKLHGWTQTDLGKMLQVSMQQVQKYESGRDRISAYKLILLASVFKIEVGELMGWGL